MALGIKITGGPLSSERLYEMTNARATELVDMFLDANLALLETMPPELVTPAQQAQWKLDQTRILLEGYFMQLVRDGYDQQSAAEHQAIRDINRQKSILE